MKMPVIARYGPRSLTRPTAGSAIFPRIAADSNPYRRSRKGRRSQSAAPATIAIHSAHDAGQAARLVPRHGHFRLEITVRGGALITGADIGPGVALLLALA